MPQSRKRKTPTGRIEKMRREMAYRITQMMLDRNLPSVEKQLEALETLIKVAINPETKLFDELVAMLTALPPWANQEMSGFLLLLSGCRYDRQNWRKSMAYLVNAYDDEVPCNCENCVEDREAAAIATIQ